MKRRPTHVVPNIPKVDMFGTYFLCGLVQCNDDKSINEKNIVNWNTQHLCKNCKKVHNAYIKSLIKNTNSLDQMFVNGIVNLVKNLLCEYTDIHKFCVDKLISFVEYDDICILVWVYNGRKYEIKIYQHDGINNDFKSYYLDVRNVFNNKCEQHGKRVLIHHRKSSVYNAISGLVIDLRYYLDMPSICDRDMSKM